MHSYADGHLGCVNVLATVKSAAMNTRVHASLSVMVFSGYMPSSGIVGPYNRSVPSFFKEFPYCSP